MDSLTELVIGIAWFESRYKPAGGVIEQKSLHLQQPFIFLSS